MRRVLATIATAVLTTATLSGQSNTLPQAGSPGILVSVHNNGLNFWMASSQTEFYLGQPALNVPAYALQGETLRAVRFTLRCWKEGDATRVVVYAVLNDARTPTRELETAIATHTLKQGASVRVTETAAWGAEPMTIRSVRPLR